jgi:hypothetical protein
MELWVATKSRHSALSWATSIQFTYIRTIYLTVSRSQWPRGLSHEMSSPAWTLGSWVTISLQAWMFVCVYSVFVLSCEVAALRRADHSSKESYQLSISVRLRNFIRKGLGPIWAVSAIGWMDGYLTVTFFNYSLICVLVFEKSTSLDASQQNVVYFFYCMPYLWVLYFIPLRTLGVNNIFKTAYFISSK